MRLDGDPSGPVSATDVSVTDMAVSSGYQGSRWLGHFFRGRAALIGDLDGDGDQDLWSGNPGEESFVVFNDSPPGGPLRFSLGPILSDGHLSWGGALADFDNDRDLDLFVSGGGNEHPEYSMMFRNEQSRSGTFSFTDITRESDVSGPLLPDGRPEKLPAGSAQAVDFDADGLLDLYVNIDIEPASRIPELTLEPGLGQDLLWHQTPDGFHDVAVASGITSTDATQQSVWLDWDRDGDEDLYENNNRGYQHLWRNLLAETGTAEFEEVTAELSLGGGDLRFPFNAFTAATGDFNLDGWEDVLIFVRAFEEVDESPYHDGHVLLINARGLGFVDVAPLTGINDPFVNWEQDTFRDHSGGGAMGGNIGDVNADGIPDVYVGQGGQLTGTADLFFLSDGLVEVEVDGLGSVQVPSYTHRSDLIDFPAPEDSGSTAPYPPYPYRTHAVNFADFDRDGQVEIAVQNGGPAALPDIVREPPRLFSFTSVPPPRWFALSLVGDGVRVNRSAIASEARATVRRNRDGAEWTLSRRVHGGNGFSANNGYDLYFGLADADVVVAAEVVWSDGVVTPIEPLPQTGEFRVIERAD